MTATTSSGAPAAGSERLEWWERQQARRQRRAARQAGRAGRGVPGAQLSAAASWAALATAVLVTLVQAARSGPAAGSIGAAVTGFGTSALLFCLVVVLARPRTISWRVASLSFCVAVVWAVLIAATLPAGRPAASEPALLIAPLALLAVAAPGRVRRFAVTDWLVLGCALGLGYQAAEQAALAAVSAPAAGTFALPVRSHSLVIALTGVCTGLGIVIGRRGGWRDDGNAVPSRMIGAILPALAFALVIGAHLPAQGTVAPALRPLRWLGGNAGLLVVLLVALTLIGFLLDTRRIRSTDEPGTDRLPYPFAPAAAADGWTLAITGPGTKGATSTFFYTLTAVVWAACCMVTYIARDLLVVLGAHLRDPGESGPQARERGRAAAVFTRVLRAEAFSPLDGAVQARTATRTGGVAGLVLLAVATALLILAGTGAPGSWLAAARAAVTGAPVSGTTVAAGLLVLAALLVLLAGAPGLALDEHGARRLLLDQGRGAVSFTRTGTAADRLRSSTVLELLIDMLTGLLTMIPVAAVRRLTGSATSEAARTAVAGFCADPARLIARRRRQLSAAPDDTGAMLAVRTGTWDAGSRRRWVDSRLNSRVYRISSADGRTSVPADGLALTPDGVAMVEATHVHPANASMLYEGQVPPVLAERLLAPFDDEMRRYATVIRDPHNPVSRLRLVVGSQPAANLLGGRARQILGHDLDLLIVVDSLGG